MKTRSATLFGRGALIGLVLSSAIALAETGPAPGTTGTTSNTTGTTSTTGTPKTTVSTTTGTTSGTPLGSTESVRTGTTINADGSTTAVPANVDTNIGTNVQRTTQSGSSTTAPAGQTSPSSTPSNTTAPSSPTGPTSSIHSLGLEDKPAFTASLVDPQANAQEKAATVEVKVRGVDLIDPALVNEVPSVGQAHLHYRVDNGPIIATTATRLSFHELAAGQHRITVKLAGNNHATIGPEQTLYVTIDAAGATDKSAIVQ